MFDVHGFSIIGEGSRFLSKASSKPGWHPSRHINSTVIGLKPLLSSLRQCLILHGASPLSGGRTTLRRVHPTESKETSTRSFFFFLTRPSRVGKREGLPPFSTRPRRVEKGGASLPFSTRPSRVGKGRASLFHTAPSSRKGRGLPPFFYSAQPSRKREGGASPLYST